MGTFRDFEHAGWENPDTCTAYRDRLGPVVAQAVEPLLDAVAVTAADRVVDVATGAGIVAEAPDRSPTFAAVFGALAQHGTMNVGLPPGPDFFRYADPAIASRDLTEAGFGDVSLTEVAQTWELPFPDDAVDALLHGTVRTAALLSRQPAAVLAEVRRSVRERLAAYDEGDAVRVPLPAVVVRATTP